MSYCENCGWKESECRCTPDDVPLQAAGQSPSLPPGSPSGVVDVLGIEAIRASFVEDGKIDARVQALIDEISRLRASLPQAPSTPAAAPVEVRYEHLARDDEMWASDEVEYEPGKWDMVGAKWMGEKYKDGMKRVRRKVPAPGSQGAEASREEAIGCLFGRDIDAIEAALDIADRKTDAFDAARAAVAGLRNLRASLEADATGGVAKKFRERLMQRIDENNAILAKMESLEEYKAASLEYTSGLEEYARGLEAKLRALEGAARVCRLLDGFQKEYEHNTLGNKMPGNDLYCDKLMAIVEEARAAMAKLHPTKGEGQP